MQQPPGSTNPRDLAQAEAAVHGSTLVFWWAAGILVAGSLVTALLFERGVMVASGTATTEPAPDVAEA
jgi:hypothetical protein